MKKKELKQFYKDVVNQLSDDYNKDIANLRAVIKILVSPENPKYSETVTEWRNAFDAEEVGRRIMEDINNAIMWPFEIVAYPSPTPAHCFCGECKHLLHEDINGDGICHEYLTGETITRNCANDACANFKLREYEI